MNFKRVTLPILVLAFGGCAVCSAEVLRYHTLVLDGQNKIIPWYTPTTNAFDNFLDKCWSWAVAAPNDTHGLPISFLYCAWIPGNPPSASASWENDVGEKIPNWVESARLYYQYSGDLAPLDYVKRLVDYSLEHGQTPTNHVWPDFPVGTANAGDTEFRGFTQVWALWDCHVDLAADTAFAMYRMYQVYGDQKYLDKAIHVADLLASHMVAGSATDSPWPYVVNSQTGANKSRYAASWDGALELFDLLIENNQGSVSSYTNARAILKNWLLTYPMQNGNWVDGHSDNKINGTGNWSTTCASDMCLYLLDHPDWDPNFLTDVPKLLKWTEDNFVNVSTPDGLAGQYYGAYVPAEQIAFKYRMGYQAARLGAQYAQWYAVSGDATYKDRAYRCFSYNTYMMQSTGQSSDGPTDKVGWWWSDCYGEGPRMYYYGMAAVPEWATPGENHLLRSSSVVTSITYTSNSVSYTTFDDGSTETLRLTFTPGSVLINGAGLAQRSDLSQPGWVFNPTNGVLRIRHDSGTNVQIAAGGQPLASDLVVGMLEDTTTNLTLLGQGGQGPLTFAILTGPTNGNLGNLNTNTGVVSYTPNLNYNGEDAFRFTVSDDSQQATGMVSLTITEVNDAPVAFDQSVTNAEDTAVAITLTGSDVDGPVTNYVVLVDPTNGTLSGEPPNLIYTPITNFFGSDSFMFEANDRSLVSSLAMVSITLTNVNDPPVLPAQADVTVGVFGLVVVTNTATDVDSPAEGLSYTLLSGTSATISTNGVIVWTPRAGPGTNRFTTIVSDDGPSVASATNAFNVVVTNAVEPPVIQALTVNDGVATVVWSAMPSGIYRLQCLDKAGNTNWMNLPPDLTATGVTAAATNVVGNQGLRFYRVMVVP